MASLATAPLTLGALLSDTVCAESAVAFRAPGTGVGVGKRYGVTSSTAAMSTTARTIRRGSMGN